MHLTSEFNADFSVCVSINKYVIVKAAKMLHSLCPWCWKVRSVGMDSAEIIVPHPDEKAFGACISACSLCWSKRHTSFAWVISRAHGIVSHAHQKLWDFFFCSCPLRGSVQGTYMRWSQYILYLVRGPLIYSTLYITYNTASSQVNCKIYLFQACSHEHVLLVAFCVFF